MFNFGSSHWLVLTWRICRSVQDIESMKSITQNVILHSNIYKFDRWHRKCCDIVLPFFASTYISCDILCLHWKISTYLSQPVSYATLFLSITMLDCILKIYILKHDNIVPFFCDNLVGYRLLIRFKDFKCI